MRIAIIVGPKAKLCSLVVFFSAIIILNGSVNKDSIQKWAVNCVAKCGNVFGGSKVKSHSVIMTPNYRYVGFSKPGAPKIEISLEPAYLLAVGEISSSNDPESAVPILEPVENAAI
jgi:hypothetical protein